MALVSTLGRGQRRVGRTLTLGLIAALPAIASAEARNLRFTRLSLEQGLSQAAVNCMLQDRLGFMWFGTQDGLNRYDGNGFSVFKHDPQQPGSLSSNTVWSLLEGRDGTLWIGTDSGGLSRWERSSERFSHFRHDKANPKSLSSDRVRALLETRDGVLWVGTDGGGLNRLDRATGSFTRFRHNPANPNSLSSDRLRALIEDRDGAVWIATDGGGLNRLDPTHTEFTSFRHDPANANSLSDDRVRSVFEDRDGVLWVATYKGGLNRLDRASGSFTRFLHDPEDSGSLGENRVRAVFQDLSGVLWVGTDGGLDEWRPGTRSFVHYQHDETDPASLSDDRVMSIYQDRGGVVWVGTQGGGLNKWNTATGSFSLFRVEPKAPTTFSGNTITALHADRDGVLWVGSYTGLNRFDRQLGRVEQLRHDPRDPGSLSDDRVMSLLVDRRGTLWVGTYEGGLNRLDPGSRRFTRFGSDPRDETTLCGNGITSIVEDPDGSLWVGVYRGGLNRFDPATRKVVRFRHDPQDPSSLSDDSVIALRVDSQGALWVGTEGGGLNRLDRAQGRFVRYQHDPAAATSLSGDVVFSIHEDRLGRLWVGTQGGGLNRWDAADRKSGRAVFRRYSERQGLPNDTVYGILEDDAGDLWLSTNRGLARLDPRLGSFTNFDTSHGLQSNEFNFGAYHRAPSGELMFGGNAGFNVFLPDRVRLNGHVPPVALTSFHKLARRLPVDPSELRAISLTHRDYLVSFEFAALDYAAPERNRYAYKLEGLDRDWIDVGAARRASYTNLPAGRYVFRVKGSNNDGVWNESGLSLPVTVLPPPWRTWWAYALYGLIAFAVLRAYTQVQARRLAREAEYSHRLEREVEGRTAELAQRNQELQALNLRLEDASLTDSLTGLSNRRFLMTQIQQDVAVVERHYRRLEAEGRPTDNGEHPDFALMMIDLDGLKGINDAYGHAAGDQALRQMPRILERACRRSDTIVRWGGDEFLVVARQADTEVAEALAERIRRAVEEHPFDLGIGRPVHLGCSVGFALHPFLRAAASQVTWEQVATIADRALYAAKSTGRNAWVGILANARTPHENIAHLINQRPELLAREGLIDLRSSIADARELAWERRGTDRRGQPVRVASPHRSLPT